MLSITEAAPPHVKKKRCLDKLRMTLHNDSEFYFSYTLFVYKNGDVTVLTHLR